MISQYIFSSGRSTYRKGLEYIQKIEESDCAFNGNGIPMDEMGWDGTATTGNPMGQRSFLWESHGTELIVMGIPWDKSHALENKSAKKIANFLLEILGF